MKSKIGIAGIFFLLSVFFIFQGMGMAQEVINFGYTGPLTGRASAIGIDALHGNLIAAKEINDGGGVVVAGKRYKVEIQSYDDEGVAAKAVAGMQRLKDKYGVVAINQNISGSLMAMLERNEKMGILLIGFFKIPEATKRGNKLVLRHQQTHNEDAMGLAEGAVKVLKAKNYAMISDVGDYGKSSAKAYEQAFEKLGVKMVANEWLDQRTQTDFRGQLTKIKAAKPDVIMLTAYDEASAGVIKQAHELGIKTTFAVSTGFGATAEKLTGPDLIEGYLRRIEYTSALPWVPAVARYRTQLYPAMGFKEPIAGFGVNCYASVHIIVRAMQKAGTTTDAFKIRQAVPLVVPLEEKYDTTGLKTFTEEGEGIITAKIGRYEKGKLVTVH
jgi:branched-chain amino acid transport system substrate-binding protein